MTSVQPGVGSVVRTIGATVSALCLVASVSFGQESVEPQPVEIPPTAAALEGIPTVRVDVAEDGATRQVLSESEGEEARLTVGFIDDQYYWTSRENRPLEKFAVGPYTYLSSDPGHYIRFTRLNDRITYEEHVDSDSGRTTTWWGELRIVVGQ